MCKDFAERLWDTSHRIAMQIAGLPRDLRNEAFDATEDAMLDTAQSLGMEPENIPKFVALQLQLIREVVARIDLGGTPMGGHV